MKRIISVFTVLLLISTGLPAEDLTVEAFLAKLAEKTQGIENLTAFVETKWNFTKGTYVKGKGIVLEDKRAHMLHPTASRIVISGEEPFRKNNGHIAAEHITNCKKVRYN